MKIQVCLLLPAPVMHFFLQVSVFFAFLCEQVLSLPLAENHLREL
jgi:hypothetical protein